MEPNIEQKPATSGAEQNSAPAGAEQTAAASAESVTSTAPADAVSLSSVPGVAAPTDEAKPFFADVPDDWREQLAGDDKKRLNMLNRLSGIDKLLDSYVAAEDKIRSGEISNGLPDNPTDEQVAAWREANGVPESPDKYELQLAEGLVLGEDDKTIMDNVFQGAYAQNVSAEAMSEITNRFLAGRQQQFELIKAQDQSEADKVTQTLKAHWKGAYEGNINRVKGFLAGLPEGVKEAFTASRMGDGKAMWNSPEVMLYFEDVARRLNPAGALVPDSINQVQAVKDKIAENVKMMGDDPDSWYKDHARQEEHRKLLEAQDQMERMRRTG